MSINFTDNIVVLNAVTVDTTSATFDMSKREQATVVYTCAAHSSGSGAFSIDASNDGTNWVTGIACRDATATASGTYVTSKTLNADGSAAVEIPMGFRYYRFVVDVTTDGTYTAVVENAG